MMIRALTIGLLLSVGSDVWSAQPAAQTSSSTEAMMPEVGKGNTSPISAYIVLLRLRYDLFAKWKATGKWPDDPAANAALSAHVSYWKNQLQGGNALLAGGMNGDYWDNAALIIFEAGSKAEADAIVANDPAVKAYVFQAQVRPFEISFISTKYGGVSAAAH